MKTILAVVVLFSLLTGIAKAEPGWSSTVIATGAERARIESTPIVHRHYRPFHFYGNTVRRVHYRGRILPTRSDFRMSIRMLRSR